MDCLTLMASAQSYPQTLDWVGKALESSTAIYILGGKKIYKFVHRVEQQEGDKEKSFFLSTFLLNLELILHCYD
jgi:hypothetical protein